MIGRTNVGGGAGLNFKVVGNPQPSNPVENTVWIDTDTPITSWVFSATEPGSSDVMALSITSGSPWYLSAPQSLSAGDVLSFEIPGNVSNTYEAINIADPTTGDEYFVRNSDGSACNAWVKGTKVSVVLSNDTNKLNGYGGNAKTAYIRSYGSYGMTEGMVWIATGTTSTVEFNALKKNDITVQILSASQYVGGAWVSKTAKIYQGGAWVELWNGELFVSGNPYESVTGGWSRSGYSISDDFNSTNNSQVTIGEQIKCKAVIVDDANGTDKGGACGTVNKVDITGYTKLRVKGSVSGYRSEVKLYVGVSTTKALTNSPTAKIALTANGNFEKTLNLPTSASSYYIFVLAAVYTSVVLANTTTLTIDSIVLE